MPINITHIVVHQHITVSSLLHLVLVFPWDGEKILFIFHKHQEYYLVV